ncbi:Protein of unknown function [Lactobacillus helveticus CIRM-BIA 953]|uniref:Uncharacterized protein n=1 Tax=Lactobacillus helveticus CIRM-BIA 953 TaxID=1226335 RepID=U4QGL6_LACHE|nr:Protein of unknown function [Lactobacillus helveticus CIRM-BIA 953]
MPNLPVGVALSRMASLSSWST